MLQRTQITPAIASEWKTAELQSPLTRKATWNTVELQSPPRRKAKATLEADTESKKLQSSPGARWR